MVYFSEDYGLSTSKARKAPFQMLQLRKPGHLEKNWPIRTLLEYKGQLSFSQVNRYHWRIWTVDLDKIKNPTKCQVWWTSWETLPFVHWLISILNLYAFQRFWFGRYKMSFKRFVIMTSGNSPSRTEHLRAYKAEESIALILWSFQEIFWLVSFVVGGPVWEVAL